MESLLLLVHVGAAIVLISLILIQQGKGADMGAAFGSGASGTVFGSSGAGNFLTKATAMFATVFFITSLSLSYFSGQAKKQDDIDIPTAKVIETIDNTDTPVLPEITENNDVKTRIESEKKESDALERETKSVDVNNEKQAAAPAQDVPNIHQ